MLDLCHINEYIRVPGTLWHEPKNNRDLTVTDSPITPFAHALAQVEGFSDMHVAVMPETPGMEMLRYVSQITGEDVEKLARIYALFLTTGRLDSLDPSVLSGVAGFAEE